MTKKNILKLINKDIDGELTPKEKELLENEISGNPEAAKLYNDFRQSIGMLKEDTGASDTIDVRNDVMNIIKKKGLPAYNNADLRKNIFIMARTPWAVAFSMGVLAGIIILSVVYYSGIIDVPSTGLSGTMSSIETYADFEIADDISIELNNSRGKISSQFSPNMVIASIDLSSDEKLTLDLRFNENNMQLYSIKPLSLNAGSNLASGRNNILINNIGENKYMIFFKHNNRMSKSDAISIRLMSESGHSANYSLLTNK